ncbi:pleiotropic drug resistance protein 1-like isoform X1 [Gossypium arboreum]|uniref:pleiotropic drug resistance protein 1-like isoform X1 n=1 Tax=Gossypium arboreum TaxID=29729 RepID=UPI0022F1B89A|nr:pleiotropic drug resistance protein 1-like isoform X1 [Gossypium arboreum]
MEGGDIIKASNSLRGSLRAGSLRAGSSSIWRNSAVDVFSRSSRDEDDEEALKWAALEKLPTVARLRKGILTGSQGGANEVDVDNLGWQEKRTLLERLVKVAEEDNERFLLKLKNRIDRVGIDLPTIEVRYENLNIEAEAFVGTSALPSVLNFITSIFENFLIDMGVLSSRKKKLTILKDVSGIVKPGRMTLLLGPPSSGKTTLLLALAGKLSPDLKFSGSVTYNGHTMKEFVPQRTAAYISQHDLHLGEITVRETLAFSARCQGVGTRYDMLAELSRREKEANIKPDPDIDVFMKAVATEGLEASVITDYILKILGLDVCADTMVGNEMLRGISGGQRKRVTTGEMLVGPARALFMDEISTGLDSSTTFQIVNSLRQTVHILNGTAVISLLQPAPETYDLFDDIILLSDGVIVYQGPREHVVSFFESMGFRCPERKGVADFLQEVTSKKDQMQYWVRKDQPYRFITANEFAEAFQSFHVGMKLGDELGTPFDKTKSHPASLTTQKYGVGKWELLKACIAREFLLMKRNSFVYIFKCMQLTVMALITMTLFFRTEMHKDSVQGGRIYMGALFFGMTMIMFNGMSELSMTISKLPVFYKQRDLLFFPSWAYALPSWILKIPITFLEVSIWVFITYYVIGFDPSAERFFRQYLILVLTNQMASGLFRSIAAIGRNMIVANTFGSFALLVLFALGGFVLSREDIKGWWIWGYWISPMMYGQNALMANEFLGHQWSRVLPGSNVSLGVEVLNSRSFFPDSYWYWIGVGGLIGFVLLFNFVFTVALSYLAPFEKNKAVISDEPESDDQVNGAGVGGSIQLTNQESSSSHVNRSEIQDDIQRSTSSMSFSMSDATVGANGKGKKGMVLPFEPHSITFDDIVYSVDMPQEMKEQGVPEDRLVLLKGVSGAFRPGVLTALMGVSGAGKTTLMDVLAGRKTGGYIDGNITVSGFPKKQETFARVSGYCEQNDIHSPHVTVYESLLYSAWLRLSSEVDAQTRKMFIEEVMELVELKPLRHALVGIPGVNGLSTEQRKRLTIAVELVANPSIIFMDEPTSGLDARAAAIVMRTVRNTVDTGRTVVCTIHQPSIDIFEAFDEVRNIFQKKKKEKRSGSILVSFICISVTKIKLQLQLFLMKRGGQEIYVGPLGHHSRHLIKYFEGIQGVSKIKDGYNPATWMLEVTSTAQELSLGVDFAEIYKKSDLYRRNKALIEDLSKPAPGAKELYFATQYSQSFLTQCTACLWKQHWSYWRNPPYTAVRFLFTTVIALMFGTVFWDLGSKTKRIQDLSNAMGSMYAAVLFLGIQNASSVQPVVAVERTVFYRERAAGMYSAMPYAIAQVLIEIPYIFVQASVYGLIVYAMIGFEWTVAKFFWYLFFMFFTLLYFTFYGMMAVAVTPNHYIAAIVSAAFYGVWNLFSGFIIPRPSMPIWWRWYYWICPVSWTLYGLVASQFGDITHMLEDGNNETVEQYLRNFYDFRHDYLGLVAAVIVSFAVLFGAIFTVSIKMFNFQRR